MTRVGIDIGGTFTDGILYADNGRGIRHEKVPSTPGEPLIGLLGVLSKLNVDPGDPELIVHGTTLVTNLILQRTGCRVGLITTRGFRDVLEIQRSYRPDPLDLMWSKPVPLVPRDMRFEVSERTTARGVVLEPPNRQDVEEATDRLVEAGAEAIAVCLLNSFANPTNEYLVRDWILEHHPGAVVTVSADVDPQIREYERSSTTVINAYAIPEVRAYFRSLRKRLGREVLLMHSGGGVLPADSVAERPVRLVQSGPAGGVIAAERLGRRLGVDNLITFDMGGTSTDVAVIVDGQLERAAETEITWGIPLRAESLEIRSVGAGGGSIAYRDEGGALKVGPRSAGAEPGPVCYGGGGQEATVTDANLVLGLLHPDRFLGGSMSLAADAARKVLDELAERFNVEALRLASGIHAVVNANMAQLIREMTVNKGRDPRDFTLVSFGGAGGQHAYAVAEMVGCQQVLFPRHSGAFSALGLVQADVRTSEAQSLLVPFPDLTWAVLESTFVEMEKRAIRNFGLRGDVPTDAIRQSMVRYEGQTHEVKVDIQHSDTVIAIYDRFQQTHEMLYGTRLDDPAELVSLHVTLSIPDQTGVEMTVSVRDRPPSEPHPADHRWVPLFGRDLPVFDGLAFVGGESLTGPVLVEESDTVIVVPPGAALTFDGQVGVYVMSLAAT